MTGISGIAFPGFPPFLFGRENDADDDDQTGISVKPGED